MSKLVIIGASGFGREVAWIVERINAVSPSWDLDGFVDDNMEIIGQEINGYKVLGDIDSLGKMKNVYAVCAVGSSKTRKDIIERAQKINPDLHFAILIDPSVEKSNFIEIGNGTIICAHNILTVNIKIGKHCIINLDCTVGHDVVMDDFVTVYPSVNISGNSKYGDCVELGTGSQIIQGKTVGKGTIVGAGSVVVKDLPEDCTAVGAPCKPIKYHGESNGN